MYVFAFYLSGDQKAYIRYYNELGSTGFIEAWILQRSILGSSEPGYAALVNLASNIFDKDVFMSMSNAALISLIFYNLRNLRFRILWIILVLVNYYLSVLFFSAERLKFAVITTMLLLSLPESTLRNRLLIAPILFHFQYILFYPPLLVILNQDKIKKFIFKIKYTVKKNSLIYSALATFLAFSFLIVFQKLVVIFLLCWSRRFS